MEQNVLTKNIKIGPLGVFFCDKKRQENNAYTRCNNAFIFHSYKNFIKFSLIKKYQRFGFVFFISFFFSFVMVSLHMPAYLNEFIDSNENK